jgi:hypothetical protein
MSWERRSNRKFFYTSYRDGTKVRKTYHGGGLVGHVAAAEVMRLRQELAVMRAQERAFFDQLQEIDRLVQEAHREVMTVVAAHLVAAGFHRHMGCEWRRRKCKTTMTP